MACFQVREYRDEDAGAVLEIFTVSMSEHVPSAFLHMLRQPLTQAVLVGVYCTLLVGSGSFLSPLLGVALLLAGARQLVSHLFHLYIRACRKQDLGCVGEAYMERWGGCFWVAESEGQVVATVACLPSQEGDGCLQLKRMAVRRSHRGLGIAKALCRTVAEFARARGFKAVLLHTSVVQTEAQRVYEGLGYRKVKKCAVPQGIAKLMNFTLIDYRYELQEDKEVHR